MFCLELLKFFIKIIVKINDIYYALVVVFLGNFKILIGWYENIKEWNFAFIYILGNK